MKAIRRIDLFMPPHSQYEVLQVFTKEFYEALKALGIECRLLYAQRDNPLPFLESIFSDPPDCTLSFNGLLPDQEGRFLCDMIKIPHVNYLASSPIHFAPLTQSPYNIITCPDRFFCHFFEGLNFRNVLFLPPGVAKTTANEWKSERKFDAVVIGSCIDFEKIRERWGKKYPTEMLAILEKAAEITLCDEKKSYIEVFAETINENLAEKGHEQRLAPDQALELLNELELYLRGKERIEMIRAIKTIRVDIFGSKTNGDGFRKFVGEKQNVNIHEAVPYEEAIEIIGQSKVLLNSSPQIKNGAHERVLSALAHGAAVITNKTVYMKEHFKEGESIAFWRYGQWDQFNETLEKLIADENLRVKMAKKGSSLVRRFHTWEERASTLLASLPPMIGRIQALKQS